jgi:hypothetical protein
MTGSVNYRWFPALLPALAIGISLPVAGQDDFDYHYRGFAIEPADRVAFGEGHLTVGLDRVRHRHDASHTRTAWPLELTVGLPAGFCAMLEAEGGTRFSGGQAPLPGERAERGVAVKYALPELAGLPGLHLALVAGTGRARDEEHHRATYSLVGAADTALGTFGVGYALSRRHSGESRDGRDLGINWFRLHESGFGFAAELRRGRTPEDRGTRTVLAGIVYKIRPGILADLGVGRTGGAYDERLLSLGASVFF